MKTTILSFSGTNDFAKLINARRQAEGMTRSEYMRKCVREEAERAASNNARMFRGMDLKSLLTAVAR
jgi:hypothetical protein